MYSLQLYIFLAGKPKGGHKGRSKRYMTEEEVAEQEEKRRREQEWKVWSHSHTTWEYD